MHANVLTSCLDMFTADAVGMQMQPSSHGTLAFQGCRASTADSSHHNAHCTTLTFHDCIAVTDVSYTGKFCGMLVRERGTVQSTSQSREIVETLT